MKTAAHRLCSAALLCLLGLAAGATTLTLTGCNTVEGVGEDLGAAGDGINDAAERSGATDR